ncbi:MAG: transcription antitermination protein NusB [Leptospirales bacterium]|nr:transcription antitermination protein NusB [Leptospirales bacterium]
MSVPPKRSGQKKHRNSHAREVALQALYQLDVVNADLDETLRLGWLNEPMDPQSRMHSDRIVRVCAARRAELDQAIRSLSHKDITQLSSVVRCVLRMGMAELDIAELPADIVLDDLLNLTRKYDGEDSVGFVNGILDAYLHRQQGEPA